MNKADDEMNDHNWLVFFYDIFDTDERAKAASVVICGETRINEKHQIHDDSFP